MFSSVHERTFTAKSIVMKDHKGRVTGYRIDGVSRHDALKGVDAIKEINRFISLTYGTKGITMKQYSEILQQSCVNIDVKNCYWCSITANPFNIPTLRISFIPNLYALIDICRFACLKERRADLMPELSVPIFAMVRLAPLPNPIVVPQPSHVIGTFNTCLIQNGQRIVLTTNVQNITQQPILLGPNFPANLIPRILHWVALILNE